MTQQPLLGKRLAGALSLVMIAAVSAPVAENWRAEPDDSFPLSYYPMFSAARGETVRIDYIAGIDAAGSWRPIHYRYVAGGGMNQARKRINDMVEDGRASELCSAVAANIARRSGSLEKIITIQVRSERYRLRDYFTTTARTPASAEVRHTCVVQRPTS